MKRKENHKNICQSCFKRPGKIKLRCQCLYCERCTQKMQQMYRFCSNCGNSISKNYDHFSCKGNTEKQSRKVNISFEFGQLHKVTLQRKENGQNKNDIKQVETQTEKQLKKYKEAVSQLIESNPILKDYFVKRLKDIGKISKKALSTYDKRSIKRSRKKSNTFDDNFSLTPEKPQFSPDLLGNKYPGLKRVHKDKKKRGVESPECKKRNSLSLVTALKNLEERERWPQLNKRKLNEDNDFIKKCMKK